MNKRIFNFDLDGKNVLGFDTGLNAQAFAQAKMAQFITTPGFIVYPDDAGPRAGDDAFETDAAPSAPGKRGEITTEGARVELWQPGGVVERDTMIIWGPSFPGEVLAGIIDAQPSAAARNDEALNALRFWLRARIYIEENPRVKKEPPFPGPAGALIVSGESSPRYPAGTVFFPPARLLKRTLEAEGTGAVFEAEQWFHPDLEGAEAVSFSAASMLYRIFCGVPPFSHDTGDALRQDIREAVFIPPALAAPGLDPEMAEIISRSMSRKPADREDTLRPSPEDIAAFIGPVSSKPAAAWITPLKKEELLHIREQQARYSKKNARTVKTRRFLIRNTAVITGVFIAFVSLILLIRGFVKHQAEMPTTKGMAPLEVAETYYEAFDTLDHAWMDACVKNKAGKEDIEMVTNLFVISRMRQAYEVSQTISMPAREWIEAGRPVTNKTVFGITDMKLQAIAANDKTANFEADYTLWIPGPYSKEESPADEAPNASAGTTAPPPEGTRVKDRLSLAFEKDEWRITEIIRTSRPAGEP